MSARLRPATAPGRRNFFAVTLLVLTGFVTAGSIARAEEARSLPPMASSPWAFWVGGFFPQVDSKIRIDSDLGSPGDGISLEDTLGLEDSKTVLWGGARWRFKTRHIIEAEIANLNRSGTVAGITEELDIDEETIRAGARINTEFDLAVVRATYGYSLLSKENYDLSLKAGFHFAYTQFSIDAFGDIEDVNTGETLCDPSPCETRIETSDFTIPLPHLGLAYVYQFTPKLALRSQLLFFALEISDIKGVLSEVDVDVQYQPWEQVGFGAGIRYFNVNVEDKGDSFFRGEFEFDYWGPVVYLIARF